MDTPEDNDDFRELMRQVREGSQEAAWELVGRYGEALRRAVRRVLDSRLRPKFDSLDFVQLVWCSFFRTPDRLDRFRRPEELAAFLVAIARNKVGMEARRRLATDKYNIRREQPLDARCPNWPAVADRQAGPLEVAIARERWDRLLNGQPSHYCQIIRLRLQGQTYRAIAESLQLAESTVRRFLGRLLRERVA